MKLTEAQIERQITDWLALDDWRALKTNPCSDKARGKGFGEVGMADVLYIRYMVELLAPRMPEWDAQAHVMWIEHKRASGVVRPHQLAWHEAESARGALVVVATEDFEPSLDGIIEWYRVSGLLRRKGL